MYTLAVGNTPCGKKRNASRTFYVPPLQSILQAYIHGNLFGNTDKSIRRTLQPEKRLRDER